MSKMAPTCVCGHRASEHFKQMRMRTYCVKQTQRRLQAGAAIDGGDTELESTAYQQCLCLMYKEK